MRRYSPALALPAGLRNSGSRTNDRYVPSPQHHFLHLRKWKWHARQMGMPYVGDIIRYLYFITYFRQFIIQLIKLTEWNRLLQTVKQRKVSHLVHVLRQDRYELIQLILMGKSLGRQSQGRRKVGPRKKSWLRNIRTWTGIALLRNSLASPELGTNMLSPSLVGVW